MSYQVILQRTPGQRLKVVARDLGARSKQIVLARREGGIVIDEPLGLSDAALREIEQQFRSASLRAPEHFADNRNDEDSISAAFGAVLKDDVRGSVDGFTWKTSAKKVRGRGPGAGERRFGADMAIEVQVESDGSTRRKTLLVQAKNEWEARDARLGEQASKIASLPGGGSIFDFREGSYRAVRASTASHAEGDIRRVSDDDIHGVGDALADFINCRVGSTRVFYSVDDDELIVADDVGVRIVSFHARHVVTTNATKAQSRRGQRRG